MIKNYILLCFFLLFIVVVLAQEKNDFSFAIIADPQLSAEDSKNQVASDAMQTLRQACDEINNLKPRVDFTIFLGDLVNVFEPKSVQNFQKSVSTLQSKIYLVHGNHDTKYPYQGFIDLHKEYNSYDKAYYSFDWGKWHFVVLSCNFKLKEDELLWLENDLAAARNKPTIVFEHLHLIPLGLSQLEFYGFEINTRKRLLDLMTRYGNVKYYFNGHVHNGIQASLKMSKNYRGINFITVPTIIHTRPFGEEIPAFAKGSERGGYYMTVSVKNEALNMQGRLAGSKEVFHYPSSLPMLADEVEPRWLKTIAELPVSDRSENTDFETGIKKWNVKYRYQRNHDPAFVSEIIKTGNNSYLKVRTRSTPPESWAEDEHTEVYRVVDVPPGENIAFTFDYQIICCNNGGGFARVTAFDSKNNPLLFFFLWGENDEKASYLPRCFGFELQGRSAGWNYLYEMGQKQRALFIRIPHEKMASFQSVEVNLGMIYDTAVSQTGAFAELQVSKMYVGLGTWVNKEVASVSEANFDNIRLLSESESPGCFRLHYPVDYNNIFTTGFGQELEKRVKINRSKQN